MKKEEAFEILGRKPELVPLNEEQRKLFAHLWEKYPDYESRRAVVGAICSLYFNRLRYRELVNPSDLEMFDRILRDPDTKY